MDLITLFAIALGLSFDTFAVSVSYGLVEEQVRFRVAVGIAAVMALFQGGFTVAGFFMGSAIVIWFNIYGSWVAMIMLSVLGIRMIVNGLLPSDDNNRSYIYTLSGLLVMSVSTSIDALAVGFSFAFLPMGVLLAGTIVGGVTFFVSMVAIRIGKGLGAGAGSKVEIAGGVVLLAIGLKIALT